MRNLPDDGRAPYLQVAHVLRARVAAGVYPRGGRLPSVSELVVEFGLARMTVKRGVDVLCREGLVVPRQGSGVFVRSGSPPVVVLVVEGVPDVVRGDDGQALMLEVSDLVDGAVSGVFVRVVSWCEGGSEHPVLGPLVGRGLRVTVEVLP